MASISWVNPVSGDWSSAEDWSGGVVLGANDDVSITVLGTLPYAISITTAEAVHSLTIDSLHASVIDSAQFTLGSTLVIDEGSFLLDGGGSVQGGTINCGGNDFASRSLFANGTVDQTLSSGGTLNGVTFHGTIDLSQAWSALTIINGIDFAEPHGGGGGEINFDGGDNQSSILNIAGTTTLQRIEIYIGHDGTDGTNELLNYDPAGTGAILTLENGVFIDQRSLTAMIGSSDRVGDGIINEGQIYALVDGGFFTIDATNFINKGTIVVGDYDTLRLIGSIDVALVDSITYEDPGGFVSINGTVSGRAIRAPASGLGSESISANGTVDPTLSSGGTLSDVTFAGTLDLSRAWSALTIVDGISFDAATVDLNGSNNQSSILNVVGTTTLSFVTIDIGHDGTTSTNEFLNDDPSGSGAVLTLARTVTIDQIGFSGILGSSDKADDGIINEGAINANFAGGFLTIDVTNFTNEGTITVSNGDTIRLASIAPISAALINGIVKSGGLVSINGTVAGGTITAGAGGVGSVSVLADGAADQSLGSGGTLSGVIYRGELDLSAAWSALTITNGIRFLAASGTGPATINLNGGDNQSGILNIAGTTALNNVTIDIGHEGTTGTDELLNDDPSGTGAILTLGRTVTIDQAGFNAVLGSSDKTGDGIVNDGAIDANFADGFFTIDATKFINHGTIAVSNGDTIRLAGAINPTLIASIANSGGFVSINGTITGGVITAATAGVGSQSVLADGAADQSLASGGTLSGVIYRGELDLSAAWSALTITNGIRFLAASGIGPATIDFHGGDNQSSVLNIVGTTTLNNVTIDIGHDGTTGANELLNYDPSGTGATVTLGRTVTIDQIGYSAEIGSSGFSGDSVINEGAIDAEQAGGIFAIGGYLFYNKGKIALADGDQLDLQVKHFINLAIGTLGGAGTVTGNITNAGTIEAAGGTLDLQCTIAGAGTLKIGGSATLQLDGQVAATQTVAFGGANAQLTLAAPASFAATLSGFAAGDTIDLTTFGYNTSEIVSFTENAANTQGTLTVTDGTLQTSITLLGQYVATGFAPGTDTHTGTTITYTPPGGAHEAPLLTLAHH